MSTTTKPIPLFDATDALSASIRLSSLTSCHRCQHTPSFNLDTLSFECSSGHRLYSARAATVAALVALRRARADDELSRPLELPHLQTAILCHHLGHSTTSLPCHTAEPTLAIEAREVSEEPQKEEPPLKYQWSKARSKVRAAAKAYSEQTHADY